MRIVLAFVLSPLIATLIVAPPVALLLGDFSLVGFFGLIGIFFGYPVLLFIGLPVILLMRAWMNPRMFHYIAAGVLAGLVVAVVLSISVILDIGSVLSTIGPFLSMAMLGVLFGGVSGFSFWLVGFANLPSRMAFE